MHFTQPSVHARALKQRGQLFGDFKGRAVGIGPQTGFFFPAGEGYQGYLNVRGYWDLATENRSTGSSVFVTLAFSPAAPEHPTPRRPMHVKTPWLGTG